LQSFDLIQKSRQDYEKTLTKEMTEEELKEITALLERQGWSPMLCDTPVPLYDTPVHAGNPVEPGSIPPDMVLVPKALLATQPQMMVRVKGNSMVDAGIEDGDVVKMTLDTTPRDGDIVVVAIDSECTVKSYYEDDEGQRWLVPQNKAESERYKVIRLDDELVNVHLCGVVDEVLKPLPRVSSRVLRSAVAKAKKLYEEEPKVSGQRVAAVIRLLGKEIKIQRHWYAVCRGMMDVCAFGEDEYDIFCTRVAEVLPAHKHLPRVDEMQAMAVESFAKPIVKWDEGRSPVKGARFRAYKRLGERTIQLLTMKEEAFQSI